MSNINYEEVSQVLCNEVKPHLHSHGGDLSLIDVKNKEVLISFDGNCKFCPSANLTVETLVQAILREKLNDDEITVTVQNEVSEELLSFAKQLLKK